MFCLSVQQPWAWAIARGDKRIENRTWSTSHRGLLAIHAGKSLGRLAGTDPVAWHSIIPGLPDFDSLPLGALVAVCLLTDVVPVDRVRGCRYAEGPYCWLLDDVVALDKPIPFTGRQGLFEIPDSIIPPREPGGTGMNELRLYEPPDDEPPATIPAERRTITTPRCFCGCGRRAEWPREGKPYFHSRLCGYLMALKMVSRQTIS